MGQRRRNESRAPAIYQNVILLILSTRGIRDQMETVDGGRRTSFIPNFKAFKNLEEIPGNERR